MTASAVEPSDCCPLCGAGNGCAMAAGMDVGTCWCMHAAVSPEALARLQPEARHTRCICATCGQGEASAALAVASSTAPVRT